MKDKTKPLSVAVFAASSSKVDEHYLAESYRLGQLFARNGVRLVYGAGKVGLMGAIADGAESEGGYITGVIPQFMVDEGWKRDNLSELIVTADMHERKSTIHRLSDAFVALPGGIGTWEELLECMTWKQLGLHSKPIVVLNISGFYDGLLECLNRLAQMQMMRDVHLDMITVVNSADEVLDAIVNAPKWDSSVRKQAQI